MNGVSATNKGETWHIQSLVSSFPTPQRVAGNNVRRLANCLFPPSRSRGTYIRKQWILSLNLLAQGLAARATARPGAPPFSLAWHHRFRHPPDLRTIILPVIHYGDVGPARRNTRIVFESGGTGLFLIHMGGADEQLDGSAVELRRQHPDRLIGVNRLANPPDRSVKLKLALGLDMTWVDN